MYVPQRAAPKAHRSRNVFQVAVHQHDVGGLYRNVRARAYGDAYLGGGQRRSVVNAVAHHRNAALLLKRAYGGFLAVGQHARYNFVNARAAAYGPCRALVVARQHDDPEPQLFKRRDRLGRAFLYNVGYRDQPQKPAVFGKIQGSLAFGGKFVAGREQPGVDRVYALHVFAAAAGYHAPADAPLQAVSGQRAEAVRFGQIEPVCLGLLHDGCGKRVLAPAFYRISLFQQLAAGGPLCRKYIGHARRALRNGAGLVKHNHVGLAHGLKRFARFYQYAVPCAKAVAHHYRHGRCKPKSARAGYDQHRYPAGKGKARALPGDEPPGDDDERYPDNRRHEHA